MGGLKLNGGEAAQQLEPRELDKAKPAEDVSVPLGVLVL